MTSIEDLAVRHSADRIFGVFLQPGVLPQPVAMMSVTLISTGHGNRLKHAASWTERKEAIRLVFSWGYGVGNRDLVLFPDGEPATSPLPRGWYICSSSPGRGPPNCLVVRNIGKEEAGMDLSGLMVEV